jgi:hypothetical protein
MLVTFRLLVIALAMMGVAVGVSFGIGVAYGKGDTKTVSSGLTEAQIAQIVGGGTGTGGAGNFANRSGTPAAGTTPGSGGGGNFAAGGNTTGQITAVDAQSITLTTAQGATVKVSIAPNTTVQTVATGKATDLKVGDSIIVAGARGSDGTVAATSVSAVPTVLQGLLSGNFGGGGGNQRPGAQATP